jgi:hypothetical protein
MSRPVRHGQTTKKPLPYPVFHHTRLPNPKEAGKRLAGAISQGLFGGEFYAELTRRTSANCGQRAHSRGLRFEAVCLVCC